MSTIITFQWLLGVYYVFARNKWGGSIKNKEIQMDKKKPAEVDETKRLTYVVIFMSMIVLVLFGLVPSF